MNYETITYTIQLSDRIPEEKCIVRQRSINPEMDQPLP